MPNKIDTESPIESPAEALVVLGGLAETLDEIITIIVEKEFEERWARVEKHWLVGKVLGDHPDCGPGLLAQICNELKIKGIVGFGQREIYYSLAFYRKFPEIERLPHGKNTSWTKIKKEELTEVAPEIEQIKALPGAVTIQDQIRDFYKQIISTWEDPPHRNTVEEIILAWEGF